MNLASNMNRQIYETQLNGRRVHFNGNTNGQMRVNNQAMPFIPPTAATTNARPLINSQLVRQPNQTNIPSFNNSLRQTISQSQEWKLNNENLNTYSTTDSILARALPPTLQTPKGWYSEVVESTEPLANQTETNLNTNIIENDANYQVLNSSDAPPIIFASSDEVNRIINEAPSTTVLPSISVSSSEMNSYSSNTASDYSNTPASYCASQEQQQTIVTNDQQYSTDTVENRELPQQLPIVVHKKLPNDTVTYTQRVSVRYLKPPSPPPPAPIIIREVYPPPPPPESPVQIRQRPPPPCTPPPIIIRSRPPQVPPRLPSQIIEKLLAPPRRPPRRVIVERYEPCPPKPADVVIERWLPYRRSDRRRVFFEKIPPTHIPTREPNLLIVHDPPNARINKEFINQGVMRADPQSYLQYYGHEIDSSHARSQYAHLVDEVSRNLPPPAVPPKDHPQYPPSYPSEYPHASSSLLSSIWDKMRLSSFQPQPMQSYNYPNHYSTQPQSPYTNHLYSYQHYSTQPQPPYTNHLYSYQHYYDNQNQRGDTRAMVNPTSSWNGSYSSSYPRSYLPSYEFSTPPNPPVKTIQVNSDEELRFVLSDLTNGRVPSPFRYN